MRKPKTAELGHPHHRGRWSFLDGAAAAVLFLASAAVVLWQNAHLVVLWDASYTLDTSVRIALGQMPYRDFPLVHTPLTFLIQAAILRLTGGVFFHHVLYAAIVGGLGTVLAWRIVLGTLRGRMRGAWAVSLLLAAPLTVLGIYSILPFPSYDCDTVFSILLVVLLLQRLQEDSAAQQPRGTRALLRPFIAGAALPLPLFFK
jgi:predicted membrane-bound mannosyltransferase